MVGTAQCNCPVLVYFWDSSALPLHLVQPAPRVRFDSLLPQSFAALAEIDSEDRLRSRTNSRHSRSGSLPRTYPDWKR